LVIILDKFKSVHRSFIVGGALKKEEEEEEE
jgi:hypothetical protein